MKVSICIPTYNSARTLEQTLRSVICQTYRDLEILVVDNASTDETPDLVRRFSQQDARVRHLRFEELVHGHDNFTRCIWSATSDLTAIFHADDVYRSTIIEEEVRLLQNCPEVGAVLTGGGKIDGNGTPLKSGIVIPSAIFKGDVAEFDFTGLFRAVLRYGNFLVLPSAMVRTDIYRNEIKKWPNPEFGGAADLFVFLTIAKVHKVAVLTKQLMDYRVSDVSYSYNYVRTRRHRHDLFQALDHFVNGEGRSVMRRSDYTNYEFLRLKDDIDLAVSGLIDGDATKGRELMPRLLQPAMIAAAMGYRRHLRALFFGYCTWLLSLLRLGRSGRSLLAKMRFG